MTSQEIVNKYFELYKKQGHKLIPNMSLVPEGDSTLLFVNSGMFPLVPYLSGEKHPLGTRLMDVQRALRFDDIEEAGKTIRHTTCFHMIGNWSLGDYFKKEQLSWIYSFFIEELGLDPQRIYPSVFAGDEFAPKDIESIKIIQEIFAKYGVKAEEGQRIFAHDRKENWWQRGDAVGELGGPDSEVFYYLGDGEPPLGKDFADYQDEFLEIGNSVFMQYRRTPDLGWEELPQKNVDFGGGLERIALVVQKKKDIFETDNFWPLIQKLESLSGKEYRADAQTTQAMRIVADHIRTATLIAMDGVIPSNKDHGYVLRRFIRRMVRFGKKLGIEKNVAVDLVPTVGSMLEWLYPDLSSKNEEIQKIFIEEERRFIHTLEQSEKAVAESVQPLKIYASDSVKVATSVIANQYTLGAAPTSDPLVEDNASAATANVAFYLYQSRGTVPDMVVDKTREIGVHIDQKKFEQYYNLLFKQHQELSRKGAEQKFKGGLADHSEEVVRFHTATHLLHQALRMTLGTHVQQYGSNITGERLRFDFAHTSALTEKEISDVEQIVNSTISQKLPVDFVMLPKTEAEKSGALHFFKEKYPDTVKVYFVGKSLESAFSKEFCGGPHVKNLSEMNPTFKIYKQEAVGKGVRRIYAKFA
ncbi:MAG: alanine--tRNA ligase-related protein [Patescibacteria group bacterium]|jgi:alanyl-tRNA synthetase